jgi:shikimate dehydrogenase
VLTGETRLVGIIGDPVSHSLSPRMQNAAFAARGLDWTYVPLPVEADSLETAVAGLVVLGFAGANVTIPHKTAAVAFCDEVDAVAQRAGSVNTLVIRDGRVFGSSTDGLAVIEAIECRGERVLLLGAGGAAQAVATALADAGVSSLTVSSRTPERAHALVARLRTLFPHHEFEVADAWPPAGVDATAVVNATPIRDSPLVELKSEQQVVDLAYRPEGGETALVVAARNAGCRAVVDGLEVLVRQGAASFERWTGVQAPVDVMRASLSA